jgi:hypothetical protein
MVQTKMAKKIFESELEGKIRKAQTKMAGSCRE